MSIVIVAAALVAAAAGAALGWWPLALWAQRNMLHNRMSLRATRMIAAVATAVTFALVLLRFGPASATPPLVAFVAAAVALAIVDLSEKRLPNAMILPTLVAVAALIVVATGFRGDWMSLVWALVGGAAMFVLYLLLVIVAPSSVGMGDVKLSFVIGLLLGWFGVGIWLAGLVAAFVIGGVAAVIMLALRRVALHGSIPFGPSMLAGALLVMLLVGA